MMQTTRGGTLSAYELAQLNIGVLRGPIGSPVMAEFVANLDRINALADAPLASPAVFGDACPAA
jgi:hypothetical protein